MILFLIASDGKADLREFSCRLNSIEAIFDFLNHVVAQGGTLMTAYILDQESRTDLPLAAFEGIPFSIGIQALQQEWQTILSGPHYDGLSPYHEERI